MGSCAAPSAKGDDKFITTDYLQQCHARWKWTTDYNRRSIAETAMYRVKQLFGGSLTLRDYDGQVAEAMGSFAGEGEILR
ncbi:hypothetical protein NUITMVR1_60920 (plasmid) [Raoultella ornithinolytica]|nr:hypothetical protein NUITMVR1_58250 [Raoultella ornithinolytica]BDA58433.1 hypothetical protein NUITMVR1_60920 [Raoultella ornithinolytica]